MIPARLSQTFWPPNAFRFGGGGSGNDAAQQVAATSVPVAAPPVTPSSAEVVQAQQDMRRQALKKRGFSKTVMAGDTGGWFASNTTASPVNPKGVAGASAGPGAKTLGGG